MGSLGILSLPRFGTGLPARTETVLYPPIFSLPLRLNTFRGEPASVLVRLAVDLEARIMALKIDVIERLGEEILDFSTVEDLVEWLKQLKPSK